MAVTKEIAVREMLQRAAAVLSAKVFSEAPLPTSQDLLRDLQRYRYPPPPPAYAHSVKPTATKVTVAIYRACVELPFRLAAKIKEIRFGPEGAANPRFEVVYVGGKTIEFGNIDDFPTDVDIARIALECP